MIDVMLITRCCNKKIIKKKADNAIATFRATDDELKNPDLLMFDDINGIYETQI